MKRKISILTVLLLSSVLLSLSGCAGRESSASGQAPEAVSYPWTAGESPVPAQRTGIKRQCISTVGKSYEFTDTGIYYLTARDCYLIYSDYGSDSFVEMCSRPDCGHADYEEKYYYTCDAFFGGCLGMCCYEGNLYVFTNEGLFKMKPDGTDRTQVFSLSTLGAYTGLTQTGMWNGYMTYCLKYLDEKGSEVYDFYYYKLDGSMEKPELGGTALPYGNHDGAFIGVTLNEAGERGYDAWDPETNTLSYLCDKIGLGGYYTLENAYVMQGSKVCLYTYADESIKPLFDTGLEGDLFLHCFPDCIVISQKLDEQYYMHFYNWAYESVGSVKLDHRIKVMQDALICGETAERIILAATDVGMPEYYIEKSDFGTGNTEIHKYDLPQLPNYEIVSVG